MPLSPTLYAALKTHINANTNTILVAGVATQIKDVPNDPDLNHDVAEWYNLQATPDYFVWRDIPMETVLKLVTGANFTPAQALPTSPDLQVQLCIMRAVICQGKQQQFANLTNGRTVAPMKTTAYRASLQDCMTNIPSAADTSNTPANWMLAANWVGVRDGAKSPASNAEKLFATGNGAQATPSDLHALFDATVNGLLTGTDVTNARSS